ncbi:unnamed protein product [Rotaria socialis]|nr:unnamed protein product [Rotaria socialis]
MAMHHGCFFHYCQSLYKEVQLLGLTTAYFDDDSTRLSCRSTMALALLPIELIEEAVQLIEDDSLTEMADFFRYFKYQWLTRVPPKYWNVSTLEFRTNNFAEGWHNKFNNRVDKNHPNVWRLFECLQREELSFRQQLGKVNCSTLFNEAFEETAECPSSSDFEARCSKKQQLVKTICDDMINVYDINFYPISYEFDRMIFSIKNKYPTHGKIFGEGYGFVYINIKTIILS